MQRLAFGLVLCSLTGCYQSTVLIGALPLDGGRDGGTSVARDGRPPTEIDTGTCACTLDSDCEVRDPCFAARCACECVYTFVCEVGVFDAGPFTPIDTGPFNPIDTGPFNPIDTGPFNPIDTGPFNPIDTGPFNPIDVGGPFPTDIGPFSPIDTGPFSPIDTGLNPPDAYFEPTSRALRFVPGQVLTIPNRPGLSPGPEMSFELWIRPRSAGFVVRKGEENLNSLFVQVVDSSVGGFFVRAGFVAEPPGALNALAISSPIEPNQWVHVAWVQRRASTGGLHGDLYLNGVLASSADNLAATADSFRSTLNPQPLRLGNDFTGDVDEVRLWTIPRDANQILSTMRMQLGAGTSGLAGYWTLGEFQQIANDRSLNGNDGYLGRSPSADAADPVRISDGPF